MPTKNPAAKPRYDRGRSKRAADLIAVMETQLPQGARFAAARATLAELKALFVPPPVAQVDVCELLAQVPGSLRTKAARIGISKNSVFNLLHGRFTATPATIERIKAAIEP